MKSLSLGQRQAVAGAIAREYRSFRAGVKREPTPLERKKIIAIGYAVAKKTDPRIPQPNPSLVPAIVSGATAAILGRLIRNNPVYLDGQTAKEAREMLEEDDIAGASNLIEERTGTRPTSSDLRQIMKMRMNPMLMTVMGNPGRKIRRSRASSLIRGAMHHGKDLGLTAVKAAAGFAGVALAKSYLGNPLPTPAERWAIWKNTPDELKRVTGSGMRQIRRYDRTKPGYVWILLSAVGSAGDPAALGAKNYHANPRRNDCGKKWCPNPSHGHARGNPGMIYWRDIPMGTKVELRGRGPTKYYFALGKQVYWNGGKDAIDAQAWLERARDASFGKGLGGPCAGCGKMLTAVYGRTVCSSCVSKGRRNPGLSSVQKMNPVLPGGYTVYVALVGNSRGAMQRKVYVKAVSAKNALEKVKAQMDFPEVILSKPVPATTEKFNNNPGPRKETIPLAQFIERVRAMRNPALMADLQKKIAGYTKWTHGTAPKTVTVEKVDKPGVSGMWIAYNAGTQPETTYVMPGHSKRKGAWKHQWGAHPTLSNDPEAGIVITKLKKSTRITDFYHKN